jgi:hypothetical protein
MELIIIVIISFWFFFFVNKFGSVDNRRSTAQVVRGVPQKLAGGVKRSPLGLRARPEGCFSARLSGPISNRTRHPMRIRSQG